MATWDDLPPELVAKILEMRFEGMVEDNRQRYVQRIVASFWKAVWRAKPRVCNCNCNTRVGVGRAARAPGASCCSRDVMPVHSEREQNRWRCLA
jgi:hypothetical protein